jgi:hypothetical protein
MPKPARHALPALLLALLLPGCGSGGASASTPNPAPDPPKPVTGLAVPLGGNAYLTQKGPGATEVITDAGLGNWTAAGTVASVYVRIAQAGTLDLALRAKVPSGSSTVRVTANGTAFTVTLTGAAYAATAVGSVPVAAPGYVKVDLQGLTRTGPYFADVADLILAGPAAAGAVFANDPANFYWSRRGPSDHLNFAVPAGVNAEWFYSELTVPPGQDPIGSYFMANGFSGGYFGMQVNSATERRFLFSVWDPAVGKTTLVRKGPGVTDNAFSGEGTGGQSYLVHDWKAGSTYRFLLQGRPDGAGAALYSAWFQAPEEGRWRFLATWKRPNTSTHLTGIYSFLENFLTEYGHLGRRAIYGNQWIRSSAGAWSEVTATVFTVDATGNNQQRLDFKGGAEGGAFFLQNGGFFADFVPRGTAFTRPATGVAPAVDFADLP